MQGKSMSMLLAPKRIPPSSSYQYHRPMSVNGAKQTLR
jgi:hypothetical protein